MLAISVLNYSLIPAYLPWASQTAFPRSSISCMFVYSTGKWFFGFADAEKFGTSESLSRPVHWRQSYPAQLCVSQNRKNNDSKIYMLLSIVTNSCSRITSLRLPHRSKCTRWKYQKNVCFFYDDVTGESLFTPLNGNPNNIFMSQQKSIRCYC